MIELSFSEYAMGTALALWVCDMLATWLES